MRKVVVCDCGARSTTGGDCIKCGEPLGSIPSAIAAAFITSATLTIGWVVAFLVTGMMAPWFASIYGAVISIVVAHASFGRGWSYQAIASTATLVGMTVAHVLLVLILNDRLGLLLEGHDGWVKTWTLAIDLLHTDPILFMFQVLGVLGGFFLWKQPEAE